MFDEFVSDDEAVSRHERFMEEKNRLRSKQQAGLEWTREEIEAHEQEEYALYENPVIRRFLFAQRELSNLHQQISTYFVKAIELNRLPGPGDFEKGSCGCGGNCGSGH